MGWDWERAGKAALTGGLSEVNGFMKGANRSAAAEAGPYGGVDRSNYDLVGAEGREKQYQNFIKQMQGAQAPRAGADQYSQGRQQELIQMLTDQATGRGPSMANEAAVDASQRAVSQQQAMLASGRGNPAAAARAAAQQAGAAQGSIAGNAAMGRAQEMLGAQSALGGALNAYRGQEQQLALANQNAAMNQRQLNQQGIQNMLAQSLQQAGMQQQGTMGYEGQRGQRYGAQMGTPTVNEQILGAGTGVASMMMMSDERLKENIEDGDKAATDFVRSLNAHTYDYKDEKHGTGKQLGIMAQDLERTKFGKQAVIETAEGKSVHGAKLAGALAAALVAVEKRLSKVEGK